MMMQRTKIILTDSLLRPHTQKDDNNENINNNTNTATLTTTATTIFNQDNDHYINYFYNNQSRK